MKITKTIFFLFSFFGITTFSFGQVSIYSATASPINISETDWKIQIVMSSIALGDIANVAVIDGKTGNNIQKGQLIFTPSGVPAATGFKIPSISLNRNTTYTLIISVNKKKPTEEFEKTVSSTSELLLNAPIVPAQLPKTPLKTDKASSKDDSDVYIAFETLGAKKQKSFYSTDIKIEPRFGPGKWDYVPFFHLNTSTNPEADPDKMDIGFKMVRSFKIAKEDKDNKWNLKISGFKFEAGGKVESERDFDNTNLLFESNAKFLVSPIPLGEKVLLSPKLFLGTEVGKNTKSPLNAAEGNGIARLLGGTDLLLNISIEKALLQNITWENSYRRRWLLTKELGFEANEDDNLTLVKFGKSPRDHITSKLSFGISDFFNPFIEYEWGEVPPSYKLINHSFKFGIAYKFRLNTK